jgi:hypothetical protein
MQIAEQLTTVWQERQRVAVSRRAESAERSPGTTAAALSPSEPCRWLFSRRADFWFACGGASLGVLAATFLIFFHGDRELDALDLVLSELHLGATYGAVVQRRLWRSRPIDIVAVPLIILALTWIFATTGHLVLLTSIAMYAAVWHRGRQSLGIARFYQRAVGGAVSQGHDLLFRGAIYLPMLAAMLAYTHLSPAEYDGEPYAALRLGAQATATVGALAVLSVIAYFIWPLGAGAGSGTRRAEQSAGQVHPGERWVVLAHVIAFGSGYVLGASNASFLFVLAVHHEIQYLYFSYAMARRHAALAAANKADLEPRTETKSVGGFFLWPAIGLGGALVGGWLQIGWLAPLGMGGLFCHYWLDGRIWTRRALQA